MAAGLLLVQNASVDEDATTISSGGSAQDIKAPARKLLEGYSKIVLEEVEAHVFNLFCFASILNFFQVRANRGGRDNVAFTSDYIHIMGICDL